MEQKGSKNMWIGKKEQPMRKWYFTQVWVEWKENPEDKLHLSLIPLHAYLDGVLARWFNPDFTFHFKLVPPWKIQFTE